MLQIIYIYSQQTFENKYTNFTQTCFAIYHYLNEILTEIESECRIAIKHVVKTRENFKTYLKPKSYCLK